MFLFEPIIDNIFKVLMKCTETEWDDFAYDIVSEGVQCWLFIFFSSYSTAACFWFPIFCGVQVAMLILSKVLELGMPKSDAESNDVLENCCTQCYECCNSSCLVISSSITPLFLTLYQNNAPFRSNSFDVVLTCYYWLQGLTFMLQNPGLESGEKDFRDDLRVLLTGGFNFYTYILAWIYWESGDIIEDFDYGYTLFLIIIGSIFFGGLFCILCCVFYKWARTNSSPLRLPLNGEGDVPSSCAPAAPSGSSWGGLSELTGAYCRAAGGDAKTLEDAEAKIAKLSADNTAHLQEIARLNAELAQLRT